MPLTSLDKQAEIYSHNRILAFFEMNKLVSHTTKQMNFKIALQTPEITKYMTIYTKFWKRQAHLRRENLELGSWGLGKRQGQSTEQLERTLQVDGCVLCPDRHMGYTHTHTFAETHLHETPQTHTIVLVSGYWWFDT